MIGLGVLAFGGLACEAGTAATVAPDGWQAVAPRDEIRPQFSFNPKGGPSREGGFVIRTGPLEGFDGHWAKTYQVKGGQCYRFHALRRIERVPSPRRSVLARVLWRDDHDRPVVHDEPGAKSYAPGVPPVSEPEYPTDGLTDAAGWTVVEGTYRAPSKATHAIVELYLRWAPRARVEWSGILLAEAGPPAPRKVRLATVH